MRNLKCFIVLSFSVVFSLFITGCEKGGAEEEKEKTPSVTSIFPTSGWMGDTITVYGKNFTADISQFDIKVNGKPLIIVQSSTDSIKVKVPAKLGSGLVEVSIGGKLYVGPDFTYNYRATVTTVAGTGAVGNNDGDKNSSTFNCPWGLATDANGNIYVADVYNRLIRKISVPGNLVSTIPIGSLEFYSPYNIAFDKANNMYVTDFNKHIMKIGADGSKSVIYYDPNMVGTGVAVDANNNLFVSDNTKGTITKLTNDGKSPTTFASGIITPRNIIFGKDGSMYVASIGINKVSSTGNISVVVPDQQFQGWEVAIDTAGNFYDADHFNNRIRKIDKKGIVTIIAGNDIAADIDGIGQAASFDGPQGIVIDAEGNLYVTTYNYTKATGNKVRKISFD